MKLFYDHQIFSLQRYGGVSKYFVEVIKRLPNDCNWITSTYYSNNAYVEESRLFDIKRILPNISFRGKERMLSTMGNIYSLYVIKKELFDIFHQTDYNPYCIDAIKRKGIPFVTTCHDMNFISINKCDYLARWQHESMLAADAIIAISHYTKNDLISKWGIDEKKIHVIHHGVDKTTYNTYKRLVERPYILYVGTRFSFKNFDRMLLAFAQLSTVMPDLQLVCTGKAFSNDEKRKIANLHIEKKVLLYSASEYQLSCLYRYAECFVFPSISEGFGMPLLEAMVNGCPVVCSNTSCFPEIAGNAASYFIPTDIESMVSSIKEVISTPSIRSQLVKVGYEHLNLYSWEKTSYAHYNLYKQLL